MLDCYAVVILIQKRCTSNSFQFLFYLNPAFTIISLARSSQLNLFNVSAVLFIIYFISYWNEIFPYIFNVGSIPGEHAGWVQSLNHMKKFKYWKKIIISLLFTSHNILSAYYHFLLKDFKFILWCRLKWHILHFGLVVASYLSFKEYKIFRRLRFL